MRYRQSEKAWQVITLTAFTGAGLLRGLIIAG